MLTNSKHFISIFMISLLFAMPQEIDAMDGPKVDNLKGENRITKQSTPFNLIHLLPEHWQGINCKNIHIAIQESGIYLESPFCPKNVSLEPCALQNAYCENHIVNKHGLMVASVIAGKPISFENQPGYGHFGIIPEATVHIFSSDDNLSDICNNPSIKVVNFSSLKTNSFGGDPASMNETNKLYNLNRYLTLAKAGKLVVIGSGNDDQEISHEHNFMLAAATHPDYGKRIILVGGMDPISDLNYGTYFPLSGCEMIKYLTAPAYSLSLPHVDKYIYPKDNKLSSTGGTSFAAPMVASAAALIFEHASQHQIYISPEQVADILYESATVPKWYADNESINEAQITAFVKSHPLKNSFSSYCISIKEESKKVKEQINHIYDVQFVDDKEKGIVLTKSLIKELFDYLVLLSNKVKDEVREEKRRTVISNSLNSFSNAYENFDNKCSMFMADLEFYMFKDMYRGVNVENYKKWIEKYMKVLNKIIDRSNEIILDDFLKKRLDFIHYGNEQTDGYGEELVTYRSYDRSARVRRDLNINNALINLNEMLSSKTLDV